ncbi:Ger(x)C family spore germination protein [Anaeroselena agilis]|uniref:Ger(X)C family spore germination protein n=1 Tax=Anaeroselena agilis TaxID=3063788 RepID=A0ABU3NZ17_9FIRM|nr:Ger(x)C family spore germination protein [Selenomonadales bacterium 4137-cl]
MRRKALVFAALLLLCPLLAGCYGARETEDIAFITAMGVDQADGDKLGFTYVVAVSRAVGSAQGGGQPAPSGPWALYGNIATNAGESRNLLASSISRYTNISHLKAIVVSEELARKGIAAVLDPVVRYRELRGTVQIYVAKGRAADFLAASSPRIDYLLSKYFETFALSAQDNNYFLRTDAHDVYLGLKNPGRSAFATYVAINPLTGRDRPVGERPSVGRTDTYLAGDIPRTGRANPAEFAGIAVFSGDRMVGVLGTREVRTLATLQNKARNNIYSLADPLRPEKIIRVSLRNGAAPGIDVALAGGREAIKISLFLEGEIIVNPSGINYEQDEYRELLEKQVSALVTEEIWDFIRRTQAMGSDVFGFGRYVRGHLRYYQELKGLNLEKLYKTASVEVRVETRLRRFGLMWRTSPVKPGAGAD